MTEKDNQAVELLQTFESDELRLMALIVLAMSVVGYLLFRAGPVWAKITCFVLLVIGAGLLVFSLSVDLGGEQKVKSASNKTLPHQITVNGTREPSGQGEPNKESWEKFENDVENLD